MVKRIVILSFILVFFLAACQSTDSSPTTEAVDQVSETEAATEPPPLPEVSPTPESETAAVQGEANCTVVSRQSPPDPTQDAIFPPVDASDWAHGPEDAMVTIIEYGDFQ
jgi:hypothetical protein